MDELLCPWMKRVDDDTVAVPEDKLLEFLFWCYDWEVRPVVNQLFVLENAPERESAPLESVEIYFGVPEVDGAGNETVWYHFGNALVDVYMELSDRAPRDDNKD